MERSTQRQREKEDARHVIRTLVLFTTQLICLLYSVSLLPKSSPRSVPLSLSLQVQPHTTRPTAPPRHARLYVRLCPAVKLSSAQRGVRSLPWPAQRYARSGLSVSSPDLLLVQHLELCSWAGLGSANLSYPVEAGH